MRKRKRNFSGRSTEEVPLVLLPLLSFFSFPHNLLYFIVVSPCEFSPSPLLIKGGGEEEKVLLLCTQYSALLFFSLLFFFSFLFQTKSVHKISAFRNFLIGATREMSSLPSADQLGLDLVFSPSSSSSSSRSFLGASSAQIHYSPEDLVKGSSVLPSESNSKSTPSSEDVLRRLNLLKVCSPLLLLLLSESYSP